MDEVERIAEARDELIQHLRNTFGDEAADCREDGIERGLEDNDDFIVGYLAALANHLGDTNG